MVIFNKNKEAVQHDLSKYVERIGSFTQAINILENETVSLHGKLTLAGKSAMIFCFKWLIELDRKDWNIGVTSGKQQFYFKTKRESHFANVKKDDFFYL